MHVPIEQPRADRLSRYRAPWFLAAIVGATICAVFEAAWHFGITLFDRCFVLWPSSIAFMSLEGHPQWPEVAFVHGIAVMTNVLMYAIVGALLGGLRRALGRIGR